MSRAACALALFAWAFVTLGVASAASAGLFDSGQSTLQVRVGPLPPISLGASPSSVVRLIDDGLGGHVLEDGFGGWSTLGASAKASQFVDVPYIVQAVVSVVNGSGAFGSSASSTAFGASRSGFGGQELLSGQLVLSVLTTRLSLASVIAVPLSPVGAGGTAMATVMTVSDFTFDVTITGGIFNTAPARITSVTTALVSVLTTGGGSAQGVHPITITTPDPNDSFVFNRYGPRSTIAISAGSNQLASASQAGAVTLIAPLRIQTGAILGSIPGYVSKAFVFVPEPGRLLQLIIGAGALCLMGVRRSR